MSEKLLSFSHIVAAVELHHGSMYRESGVASGFLFAGAQKKNTPKRGVFMYRFVYSFIK